jgi:hypothetical protein
MKNLENSNNYLFQNGGNNTEEVDSVLSQNFTNKYSSSKNKPNGGFPPLFECNINEVKNNKNIKKETESEIIINNLLSIHDILNKRKIDLPFISSISLSETGANKMASNKRNTVDKKAGSKRKTVGKKASSKGKKKTVSKKASSKGKRKTVSKKASSKGKRKTVGKKASSKGKRKTTSKK